MFIFVVVLLLAPFCYVTCSKVQSHFRNYKVILLPFSRNSEGPKCGADLRAFGFFGSVISMYHVIIFASYIQC